MSQYIDGPLKANVAAGAIAQYILVKTNGALAVAGLGDEPLGVIDRDVFASGDVCNVILRSKQGTFPCVAAAAITVDTVVYGRADGKIDDDSGTSAVRIGIALEAATAAGDIIEVCPC